MLQGFTSIIMQFTVNATNSTSLSKIYGYITMNDKQTYFPDYANSTEGKLVRHDSYQLFSMVVLWSGIHEFTSNESLFVTTNSKSYRCYTKTNIDGFNSDNNVTVTSIVLENLLIQPFVDDTQAFNGYGTGMYTNMYDC
jgi:hypothetical protein